MPACCNRRCLFNDSFSGKVYPPVAQEAREPQVAIACCQTALALDVHHADAQLLLGSLLCARNTGDSDLVLAHSYLTNGLQDRPLDRQGWYDNPATCLSCISAALYT